MPPQGVNTALRASCECVTRTCCARSSNYVGKRRQALESWGQNVLILGPQTPHFKMLGTPYAKFTSVRCLTSSGRAGGCVFATSLTPIFLPEPFDGKDGTTYGPVLRPATRPRWYGPMKPGHPQYIFCPMIRRLAFLFAFFPHWVEFLASKCHTVGFYTACKDYESISIPTHPQPPTVTHSQRGRGVEP